MITKKDLRKILRSAINIIYNKICHPHDSNVQRDYSDGLQIHSIQPILARWHKMAECDSIDLLTLRSPRFSRPFEEPTSAQSIVLLFILMISHSIIFFNNRIAKNTYNDYYIQTMLCKSLFHYCYSIIGKKVIIIFYSPTLFKNNCSPNSCFHHLTNNRLRNNDDGITDYP